MAGTIDEGMEQSPYIVPLSNGESGGELCRWRKSIARTHTFPFDVTVKTTPGK